MSSMINPMQKSKYTVLQEAKMEINQLNSQYKIHKNLNLKIDLNDLKEKASKKFISLYRNAKDPKTTAILNDIKKTIETEYQDLFQRLKAELLALSSKEALKKIIRIMENPDATTQTENEDSDYEIDEDEDNYGIFRTVSSFRDYDAHLSDDDDLDLDKIIEGKVNKVLNEFPGELLFNRKKISELSESDTKISQMLTSLEAIQESPRLNFNRTEIYPEIYSLHSTECKSYSHVKSLSNILSGDCFFITLFGEPSHTRRIISKIAGKKQKSHDPNDTITIYGPVDITSLAGKVPDSFNKLKQFNIVFPKLFFFEVSSNAKDKMFLQWANFLSFISHVIVFSCEDSNIKIPFQSFENLGFDKSEKATLINCSPSKTTLKYNIDIETDEDNEEILFKTIFDSLFEKSDKFIPHETAEKYAELIINEKTSFSIQRSSQEFDKTVVNDYSLQMYNRSLDEFHQIKEKMLTQSYSLVKSKKYVDNFNLDEQYTNIKSKIQQFLFTNTYSKLWNEKSLIDVSKVLDAEVEKEFNSSVLKMRNIENIGKLLKTNEKSFPNEADKIIPRINCSLAKPIQYTHPNSPKECKSLKNKLEKQYSKIVQDQFGEQEMDQFTDEISNELYKYLSDNPIASDDEYGTFYMNLYKKHYEPEKDQLVKKTFQFAKTIRAVPSDYYIEEYTVTIDKDSFNHSGIKINGDSSNFNLVSETTAHELYELVKKTYKLQKVPFVISKTIFDGKNKVQVEIFDDDSKISRIKGNTFKVSYDENTTISTSTFIQSMVVQKEIKIADDFIIRAHSKNAEFKVEYPKEHSGWFDVEFNITSPNPDESFGVNGAVLIYLKLSANEMNYLKEGNSIVHKSFSSKNNWEIEEDQVFLSYPKCNTAVILLRHCSMHKITPIETKIDELVPSKHKNTKYSRDWEGMNGNRAYKRGGRPYYLPVGYIAEGILVDNFDENTCVAFHGTKARYVSQIIKDGFKLPSECHGVQKGHYKLGREIKGKKDWANAVFVSPSIKYSSLYGKQPIIAFSKGHCYVEAGHVYHDDIRIVILQCRVQPDEIEVFPNSTKYEIIDSNFNNNELEWRITDTTKLFPYRVLTRNISKDSYFQFFKTQ